MTPRERVYMLPSEAQLSYRTVHEIFKSGYSRVPVYGASRDDVLGLLFTKDLIFVDPADETPVRNFMQVFGRHVHVSGRAL
jgi:metal transporter CNNM